MHDEAKHSVVHKHNAFVNKFANNSNAFHRKDAIVRNIRFALLLKSIIIAKFVQNESPHFAKFKTETLEGCKKIVHPLAS